MNRVQECAARGQRLLNQPEIFYFVAFVSCITLLKYERNSWSDPFEEVHCGIVGVFLGFYFGMFALIGGVSQYLYLPTIAMIGSIVYHVFR
jgi:hypothetical protein